MKVYVVTGGLYDDGWVDRVFADEVDAQEYAALRSRGGWGNTAEVKACDVETAVPSHRPVYQFWWRLSPPNGLPAIEESTWIAVEGDAEYGYVQPHVEATPVALNLVKVTCTDRDLARKALDDRMAALKAEAAGL